MRLLELFRKHNYSTRTINVFYDYLGLEFEINVNLKLNDLDIEFIDNLLASDDFDHYYQKRIEFYRNQTSRANNAYKKMKTGKQLSFFEKRLLMLFYSRSSIYNGLSIDNLQLNKGNLNEDMYQFVLRRCKIEEAQIDREKEKERQIEKGEHFPETSVYSGESCPACGSSEYMCCNYWIEQHS